MTVTMTAKSTEVTVPAGEYFLGDPCYVADDDAWDALLTSSDFFQASPVGTLPSGDQVLGFGTKWGDGGYLDQHGNDYSVDAGLIGLTPITSVSAKYDRETLERLGRFVIFTEPTRCVKDDGLLIFGDYVIDTDPSYFEDEDDDDDEDDD
jgi:hypothetical protein